MKLFFYCIILFYATLTLSQTVQVRDKKSDFPIAYATVSFGNGLGTFAGDNGVFAFDRKKYKDVDSLFITSLGYNQKSFAASQLPKTVYLEVKTDQLEEVVIIAPKKTAFKTKKIKVITHNDYFKSWLPTVESEIAVLFNRIDQKSTQITNLIIPVNAELQYKTKGKGRFATVFRLQFYHNNAGKPGDPIVHNPILFNIDQDVDKKYNLNISNHTFFIPKNGCFASIQVLGYADKTGKLLQSKKYHEVETRRGIVKTSTTFRPLIPFTNKLPLQNTFVRRIFLNNKKWQTFDRTYNKNSKLVEHGYTNLGMGAILRVYKN